MITINNFIQEIENYLKLNQKKENELISIPSPKIKNSRSAFLGNKLRKEKYSFLFLIGLIILSACNNVQKSNENTVSGDEKSPVKSINEVDSKFLINAAEISLEEMRLGDLAEQKTQTKEVRELAQMLVLEHGNTLNSLTEIAQKNNIIVPSAASDKAIASFEKLNKNSGKAFDMAYCEMMALGHKEAINSFEKEIKETSNIEIKIWAQTTLLTLKMHLDHVEKCILICEKM